MSDYRPTHIVTKYVAFKNAEPEWWKNLMEPVPLNLQCKDPLCKLAPQGHKKHPPMERNYTLLEDRLIIKYLVHFDEIMNGKGLLTVWATMHERGYMKHRTPESLKNHYSKHLLRNIRDFNLPQDLQEQFLAMVPK